MHAVYTQEQMAGMAINTESRPKTKKKRRKKKHISKEEPSTGERIKTFYSYTHIYRIQHKKGK